MIIGGHRQPKQWAVNHEEYTMRGEHKQKIVDGERRNQTLSLVRDRVLPMRSTEKGESAACSREPSCHLATGLVA